MLYIIDGVTCFVALCYKMPLNKMADMAQTPFSYVYSEMKIFILRFNIRGICGKA